MVVDVTNLEPSQNINLNLNKSNQLATVNQTVNRNLPSDKKTQQNRQLQQDKIDLNNNINTNLKTTLETKNIFLNVSNTLNQAANRLGKLRDIAQQNLLQDITNNQRYENQYKFEELKNDFNKFVEDATYKSANLIQRLSNEGVVFRNNENTETFKLNKFEIDGFNKNNFKIENLNVQDEKNTEKAINSLQEAEKYFRNEEERFNSANNRLSEDLLNLLKENIASTNIQTPENSTSDIKDVTDLLMKNPNEFYNSQANLIQNSYLELLQEM